MLIHYQGGVYHFDSMDDLTKIPVKPEQVKTLQELCSEYITWYSSLTKAAITMLPPALMPPLMNAAVYHSRDLSINILLSNWPHGTLCLKDLAPALNYFPHSTFSLNIAKKRLFINKEFEKAARVCSTMINKLLKCIRERTLMNLHVLDLCGFPVLDKTLCKLASLRLESVRSSAESSKVTTVKVVLDAHIDNFFTLELLRQAVEKQENSPLELQLNKLEMSCFSVEEIQNLMNSLPPQHLKELDLQFCSLQCRGFNILSPAIQVRTNLTALDLSCNNIALYTNERACENMAQTLQSLPCLVNLNISNTRIKGQVRSVLSYIRQPLHYLCLSACGLSVEDVGYLSGSHHTSGLRELDLSANNLGKACQYLQQMLCSTKLRLRVLELEDCKLSSDNMKIINPYLLQMKCLEVLNMCDNTLSHITLCDLVSSVCFIPTMLLLFASYSTDVFVDSDAVRTEQKKRELALSLERIVAGKNNQTLKIALTNF